MKTYKVRTISLIMALLILLTVVPFNAAAKTEALSITFESPVGVSESGAELINVTTDKFDTCYGNQLTGMSREIYDAFTAQYAVKKDPSDVDVMFKAPYKFTDIAELSDAVGIEGQAALDAFCYDHPEVYWLRLFCSSFSFYSSGGKYVLSAITISPLELYDGASDNIAAFDKAVDEAVKEISGSISDTDNRREVLLKIHNYVCENASYAPSFNDEGIYSSVNFFIGSGYVVCEGYSKTFKILCDRFGIPCVLVSGTADSNIQVNAPHMWNYVEMEDGRWYLIDTTWDDQGSRIYETYFLANYNSDGFYKKISAERRADGDFSNSGKKQFVYPDLSRAAYAPHTHIWDSDFTVDKNAKCEEDGLKSIHCGTCDATQNQTVIPQTGHEWQVSADKKVCSLCGKTELIPTEPTTAPTTATTTARPTEPETVPTTTAKPTEATTVTTTVPTTAKPTEATTVPTTVPATAPSEPETVPVTEPSTEATTAPSEVHIHSVETLPAKKATYKESGLTEGKICSLCGEILEAQKAIPVKKLSGVTGFKVKSKTENTVKLSFKKVTGAEKYTVYYSTNKKKWKSLKADKTTVSVKGLKAGTKYFFKVKALAGKYSSEDSTILTTATKPSRVSLTSVKSAKKSTATVSWKTVTGAEGYIVEYSTSKSFKSSKKITVKKQKSKKTTIKKLKSGKKYYVRVKAYKTVNGKRVYGKVSASKNIKVK